MPENRPLRGSDKLALLLSFVPWLVDRDRVGVAEAAAHFGIPEQLVRELVMLIAVSGVPGATATYQHDDLFDIDWDAFEERDEIVLVHRIALEAAPRFSAREAAAVIAGLQYLSALPGNAERETIASLFGKLSRSASADPSPLAVAQSGNPALLGIIRDAVEGDVQLELDYLNARGERERRLVDPLRIDSVDDQWYLRGWCHLREAVRTFRFDRIAGARLTDRPRSHRPDELTLPETLFETSPDDPEVELELDEAALPLLADFLRDARPAPAGRGRVRAAVRVAHYHLLKRIVAGLPGMAVVVGPAEARQAVREWAEAGAARYRG